MQELRDRLHQLSHLPESQIELILSASTEEDIERLVGLPDEQFQTAINAIIARLNTITQAPLIKVKQSQDSLKRESPQVEPDLANLRLKINRDKGKFDDKDRPLVGGGMNLRPQGHSEAPQALSININGPKTNPGEIDTSSLIDNDDEDSDHSHHNDTILFKAANLDNDIDRIPEEQLAQLRETKDITETQIVRDAEEFEKIRQESPSLTMVNPNKNDPYIEESFQADLDMHTQTGLPEIKVKRKTSPKPFIFIAAIAALAIIIFFVSQIDFSSSDKDKQSAINKDSEQTDKSNTAQDTKTKQIEAIDNSTIKTPVVAEYQAPILSKGKWALHLVPGYKGRSIFSDGQLEILDNDITVELWLSLVRTQIKKVSLIKILNADEQITEELFLNKEGQICFSSVHQESDNLATITFTKKIPANGMHYHVAATRKNNKISLYINGKLRKQFALDYPKETLRTSMIIADRKFDDESYGVFIDELMISKTAKYPKDFKPSRILNMTADTVAYAPFERYSLLNFAIYTAQSHYDTEEVSLPEYSWHDFAEINKQVQDELNR